MNPFGVYHPWSFEYNLQSIFNLHSLLNDIWIIDIWKLLEEGTFLDTFHVVSRFIWIYTVIKPEVINLLEISWCEFAVPFIQLLILQNLFQLTWFVTYTICQPYNKAIVNQHIIETVTNEFQSFFLVSFEPLLSFLKTISVRFIE